MSDRVAAPAAGDLRHLASLTGYWLGLSVLWGALSTIVVPRLVEQLVPPVVKTTALATVTGLQALVSILVQPISGAASDDLESRWGRRRPLIVAGVTAQVVFLFLLAQASAFWAVLLIMLLVELASNTAQGPWQALLPDTVPPTERGLAAGLVGAAQLGGQVLGVAVAGVLAVSGDTSAAILFAGAAVTLGMATTVLGVRERPSIGSRGPVTGLPPDQPVPSAGSGVMSSGARAGSAAGGSVTRRGTAAGGPRGRFVALLRPRGWFRPVQAVVLQAWRPDAFARRDYAWLLASRLAILMATGTLQPFIYFYLEDALGLGDRAGPAVAPIAGLVALAAVVAAIPGGLLATRVGRVRTVATSGFLGALGAAAFAAAPSYEALFLVAVPFGVAMGVFLSADWSLLVDLVPPDEAGRYLGLSNVATAGAGLLAVALAGPLADAVNGLGPGLGYRAVFVLAAIEFALGAMLARRVSEPELTAPRGEQSVTRGAP